MLLADMGADVVRVESPDGGDPFRTSNEAMFTYLNRNKRAIAINLKSNSGRSAFLELVRSADVVLDNFAPGVVERLGLSFQELSEVNPRIIYLSLKGFLPGPYGGRPLLDELAQMMGGLAFMTGPPGRPLRAGAAVVDLGGAAYGVIGVLGAIIQREETGRGQNVKTGLFETVVYWNGQHMADAAASGLHSVPFPERAQANRLGWGVYDLFDTSDERMVFVGVTSDAHWRRFCVALNLPELADDPNLRTNALRMTSRNWLIPRLQECISAIDANELQRRLDEAGVPFAPVNRPDELADDSHLNESGQLLESPVSSDRHAKLPKPPFTSSEYDITLRRPAPGLGEHTREILHSAGFSESDILALAAEGSIGLGQPLITDADGDPEEVRTS
jgi:crotonobetainyl-CoA:carnitine CoA-transferase CaiB-like acyl-CoA transferase